MATPVIMPKQGNTVESCLLLTWTKSVGETLSAGDTICETETDKATLEVESPVGGVLLKQFFAEGDDVPVQSVIALVGEAGEEVEDSPSDSSPTAPAVSPDKVAAPESGSPSGGAPSGGAPATTPAPVESGAGVGRSGVSPRAQRAAEVAGVDPNTIVGSGPDARVIERDVLAKTEGRAPMTPAAVEAVSESGGIPPEVGGGLGGRILSSDLKQAPPPGDSDYPGPVDDIPVVGVRKLIAGRLSESLRTTAQVTTTMYAEAVSLLEFRQKFKESGEEVGVSGVTINDMVMFAVTRVLRNHPKLNAHWLGSSIRQFGRVHLGFAVDTDRGLMVPVIRSADLITLRDLSLEAKRLVEKCKAGKTTPEDITGGSFTVSNLGSFGVESFTPVLNPPEVGILGVGGLHLRPVVLEDKLHLQPHLGLSLTFDHQALDGADAARFLVELRDAIASFELTMAK